MFFSLMGGTLFIKFFVLGIILGAGYEICKIFDLIFKHNILITNTINFVYFLTSGTIFCSFLINFANGIMGFYIILALVVGIVLEQISIGFFFTKFYKLLYNACIKLINKTKSTKFGSKILR